MTCPACQSPLTATNGAGRCLDRRWACWGCGAGGACAGDPGGPVRLSPTAVTLTAGPGRIGG